MFGKMKQRDAEDVLGDIAKQDRRVNRARQSIQPASNAVGHRFCKAYVQVTYLVVRSRVFCSVDLLTPIRTEDARRRRFDPLTDRPPALKLAY